MNILQSVEYLEIFLTKNTIDITREIYINLRQAENLSVYCIFKLLFLALFDG